MELKEYLSLENVQDMLRNNDLDAVYKNLFNYLIGAENLTQFLMENVGIDPLEYVTCIYPSMYHGSGFEDITVPRNVTYIYNSAFRDLTSLRNIRLHEYIDYIGGSAFQNCTNLYEVYLPKNLTRISACTFKYCHELSEVYLPKSVTKIDTDAFLYCSSLQDIYYEGSNEDYENIKIEEGNELFKSATVHYNAY